jgi:hypothetical protein
MGHGGLYHRRAETVALLAEAARRQTSSAASYSTAVSLQVSAESSTASPLSSPSAITKAPGTPTSPTTETSTASSTPDAPTSTMPTVSSGYPTDTPSPQKKRRCANAIECVRCDVAVQTISSQAFTTVVGLNHVDVPPTVVTGQVVTRNVHGGTLLSVLFCCRRRSRLP